LQLLVLDRGQDDTGGREDVGIVVTQLADVDRQKKKEDVGTG
jgi:hypothetical protein